MDILDDIENRISKLDDMDIDGYNNLRSELEDIEENIMSVKNQIDSCINQKTTMEIGSNDEFVSINNLFNEMVTINFNDQNITDTVENIKTIISLYHSLEKYINDQKLNIIEIQ